MLILKDQNILLSLHCMSFLLLKLIMYMWKLLKNFSLFTSWCCEWHSSKGTWNRNFQRKNIDIFFSLPFFLSLQSSSIYVFLCSYTHVFLCLNIWYRGHSISITIFCWFHFMLHWIFLCSDFRYSLIDSKFWTLDYFQLFTTLTNALANIL